MVWEKRGQCEKKIFLCAPSADQRIYIVIEIISRCQIIIVKSLFIFIKLIS